MVMQVNPNHPPANATIKVLLGFYYKGQPQAPGAVIEVTRGFAHEMISANKAAFVNPDEAFLEAGNGSPLVAGAAPKPAVTVSSPAPAVPVMHLPDQKK